LALRYWQHRQQVSTHNLANVETTGFQAKRVFSTLTASGTPALGTTVDERRGAVRETGSPLDLTVVGGGRLVVRSEAGEEYVRSGSFALDGSGQVIDERGRRLLAENGSLVLPPGPVEIDAGGNVSVAGERVARLRIDRTSAAAAPDSTDNLRPRVEGRSAEPVQDPGEARAPEEDVMVVRQGYLEGSNVSALDALVELTTIQRSYEAVLGSVRTMDATLETIANRLGRVG
jgi:flagellar basal-body rod protein FlgF